MAVGSTAVYKLKRKLIDNESLRNLHRKFRSDRYSKETLNSQGCREIDALLIDITNTLTSHHEDFPMFQMVLREFCNNIRPLVAKNANFVKAVRLLCEPESTSSFTVTWRNQHGEEMTNMGWRCNYSSVLGPCRGGIRMHPSVNQDVIIALAFQVTLQNALSNLPMGGCFMGTNFDARNHCDADVQSFCFEFVQIICKELPPHWPFDITCDLGCGPRECAMLDRAHTQFVKNLRMNRKLSKQLQGGSGSHEIISQNLTGSNVFGAKQPLSTSLLASSQCFGSYAESPTPTATNRTVQCPKVIGRPYSVGIGAIEFAKLFCHLPSFDKEVCMVSGSGDAALTVAKCLIEEGAIVITMSDSSGFIYCPGGISYLQWQRINQHRAFRVPLKDIITEDGWVNSESRSTTNKWVSTHKGNKVHSDGIRWYAGSLWDYGLDAKYVFPCAHELELDLDQAQILVEHSKVQAVLEISYSSCTTDAQYFLLDHKVKLATGKLCNMAPMISLGMHLAEKMEKAQFEHEIKSYMTYVYNFVKSVYSSYYPDVYFKEAVDCAALFTITKEMKAKEIIE